MTTPDELLPLVDHILKLVGEDGTALERWSQTADGQKVIQYVVQIGKYNTNLGEGKDISIGDTTSVQGDWVGGDKVSGDKVAGHKIMVEGDRLSRSVLEEIRDFLQSQLAPPPPEIDWQQVSRSLLEERLQLTTNPMTRGEDIAYGVEQVYVPLGLMERKKVPRRKQDVAPEQGSALYQEDGEPERSSEKSKSSQEADLKQEIEITQRFEHEQFLEQVLHQGQSPKSQGKRIAVIGEPGAGKTTLLQQMARWVAENIAGAVAIWVSLADLQGRSVEDYLLGQWLPAAVQQQGRAAASTRVKDAFVGLFQAGRVWLLLDGVDEMPGAAGNPLGEMERQVRLGGLLSQVRLVLTCRLNLWDSDHNPLDTFDVYRTLEFAYPGQVEQFVGQWFEALPEGQAGQAERLCEALRQPGQERLRDLVKNPLRLTLLCFNWYLGEGTLPETKAGLYEQFVADFYQQKWKKEPISTTAEQRRRLNAALGELAREAIDKEETRFRLRHDFVCQFLGEPDEPDSLFQMALRLGWLNQIGVDAENRRNRRKVVYAFFHPTFQEYFAALAIDDCHFFFNHTPEDISQPKSSYRIFEPRFKEVLLLWLGQAKNELEDEKNKLIQNLMEFKDGCGDYYTVQAICLAAFSIGEFNKCKSSDSVISEVSRLCFGFFDDQNKSWRKFPDPVPWLAEIALLESDREKVIDITANSIIPAATNYLHPNKDEALKSAKILGLLGQGNPKAIKALIQLIQCENLVDLTASLQPVSSFFFVRIEASKSLAKIAAGNEQAWF